MTTKSLMPIALIAAFTTGCSNSTSLDVVESRQNTQENFDLAIQKLANGEHAAAKELLDSAISSGNLYIDYLTNAYINRAICSAVAGDFAAAHADLDLIEQGPVDLDKLWAARSFVYEKEGKASQAKAAWTKARKHNRGVAKIKG